MLIKCYHCKLEFNRKPSEISKHNFCSRECLVVANIGDKTLNPNYRGGQEVPCGNCGRGVYCTPYKVKSQKNHFCSRKCQGVWTGQNLVGDKASNYKGVKYKSYCQMCDGEFEHWGQKRFCSYRCKSLSQRIINVLICEQCKNEHIRRDCELHWATERKHKLCFCCKQCKDLFYTGENHPNWVKDRSKLKSEVRSIRYSTKMKEWRKSVFARDDYGCVKCGDRSCKDNPVVLNSHHIKRFTDSPDLRFDINNGITLCVGCHSEVTGKEVEFEKVFLEMVKTS